MAAQVVNMKRDGVLPPRLGHEAQQALRLYYGRLYFLAASDVNRADEEVGYLQQEAVRHERWVSRTLSAVVAALDAEPEVHLPTELADVGLKHLVSAFAVPSGVSSGRALQIYAHLKSLTALQASSKRLLAPLLPVVA
jgi:hypothetical protein